MARRKVPPELQVALPGWMPRPERAKSIGKCDRTAARWQARGLIVVGYLGAAPYVHVQKTAERMAGATTCPVGRKRGRPRKSAPEPAEAA
jgi:hypothetical protein